MKPQVSISLNHIFGLINFNSHQLESAAYLENREGGGARVRRAPPHPRRAPYGREIKNRSVGVGGLGGVFYHATSFFFA